MLTILGCIALLITGTAQPVEAVKPTPPLTLYIGIDIDENSSLLKSELQRNWNPYKYHQNGYYSPWSLKEEHKDLDIQEVNQLLAFYKVQQKIFSKVNIVYLGYDDVTAGVQLPAIRFRKNGKWESMDKRAFTTTGFPLKTIEWHLDLFFIDEVREKYQDKITDFYNDCRRTNNATSYLNRDLIFFRQPQYKDYYFYEDTKPDALYIYDPKQRDWILIHRRTNDTEPEDATFSLKVSEAVRNGYRAHQVEEKIHRVHITSPTDKTGKTTDIPLESSQFNIWLRPEPFPMIDDYEPPAPWEKPIKVIPNIYQDEIQKDFKFEKLKEEEHNGC